MKKIIYAILICIVAYACNNSTESNAVKDELIFPLAIGNQWDYWINAGNTRDSPYKIDSNHFVFVIKDYSMLKWRLENGIDTILMTYSAIDTLRHDNKFYNQYFAPLNDGVLYGRFDKATNDTLKIQFQFLIPKHPKEGKFTLNGEVAEWKYYHVGQMWPKFENDSLLVKEYDDIWYLTSKSNKNSKLYSFQSRLGFTAISDSEFNNFHDCAIFNYKLK